MAPVWETHGAKKSKKQIKKEKLLKEQKWEEARENGLITIGLFGEEYMIGGEWSYGDTDESRKERADARAKKGQQYKDWKAGKNVKNPYYKEIDWDTIKMLEKEQEERDRPIYELIKAISKKKDEK